MIKTSGVRHVHLYVRDLERSCRFYQETFGLEEKMRFPAMVFLGTADGDDSLALHEDPAMISRVGDNGGYAHFGMYPADQSDLNAMVADVERAGGRLIEQGEHAPGVPYLLVSDPDGYLIEL